jgi:polysaccharide pyruvyl transferase WcaK-like protein
MILVLHGAKVNAGDFLIRDRGLAIMRRLRPEQELVLHPRWDPVSPELFDRADAVVLCGGPGLAPRFYPQVFPLVDDLDAHPTPILPLALGWGGAPSGRPDRFFNRRSVQALRTIHSRIGWSGVRDDLSLELLQSAKVGKVRRTGCVAWYDQESLGSPFRAPAKVRRLAFTPPAKRRRAGLRETIAVMRRLRARYREAERFCVFHRGMRAEFASEVPTRERRATAIAARVLGFHVIDASGDVSALELYRDCDLHVGYRVHAHLSALSFRRPSLLVIEDGRGEGQAITFGDPYRLHAGAPQLADALDQALAAEQAQGFEATEGAVTEIERTWPVMRETVEQLPRR